MIFKMYNSDFGFKYNGQNYDFDHVENFTIENPEQTRITRGANGTSKMGIVYKEGIKEPKKVTVTIIGMSIAIKEVLDNIFNNKDRLDVYAVDRSDGSSKIAKNAVLCQEPMQLSLDEGAESMNVALVFESFDLTETHKS